MTDWAEAAGITFLVMVAMLFIFGFYEKNTYGEKWQLHIKYPDGNYSNLTIQGYEATKKTCEALNGKFMEVGCNNDAMCEVKKNA
jgi:hypothetical protein